MSAKVVSLHHHAPRAIRETAERVARARFRAARRALGWSQLQAAMWLGVARSTVEDWERGATRVQAWALVALEQHAAEHAQQEAA